MSSFDLLKLRITPEEQALLSESLRNAYRLTRNNNNPKVNYALNTRKSYTRRNPSNLPPVNNDSLSSDYLNNISSETKISELESHQDIISKLPECPTFYPTEEEFRDSCAYISSLRHKGGEEYGIIKIIPPHNWKPDYHYPFDKPGKSYSFTMRPQHVSYPYESDKYLDEKYPDFNTFQRDLFARFIVAADDPRLVEMSKFGKKAEEIEREWIKQCDIVKVNINIINDINNQSLNNLVNVTIDSAPFPDFSNPAVVEEHFYRWFTERHSNFQYHSKTNEIFNSMLKDATGSMTYYASDVDSKSQYRIKYPTDLPVPPPSDDITQAVYKKKHEPINIHTKTQNSQSSKRKHTESSNSSEQSIGDSNNQWSLTELPLLSSSVLGYLESDLPGISTPMLYIGMLFSAFCCHCEDQYLYSISYHHRGRPKIWYGSPGKYYKQIEDLADDNLFLDYWKSVDDFRPFPPPILPRKNCFISPPVFIKHKIPVCRAVQTPNSFIVTYPGAYHSGFSTGFNISESVNFATFDWLSDWGRNSIQAYTKQRRWAPVNWDKLIVKMTEKLLNNESMDLNKLEPVALELELVIKNEMLLRSMLKQYHPNLKFVESKETAYSLLKLNDISPSNPKLKLETAVHCPYDTCKQSFYLSFIQCTSKRCPNHKYGQYVCLRHYDDGNTVDLIKCEKTAQVIINYTENELLLLFKRLNYRIQQVKDGVILDDLMDIHHSQSKTTNPYYDNKETLTKRELAVIKAQEKIRDEAVKLSEIDEHFAKTLDLTSNTGSRKSMKLNTTNQVHNTEEIMMNTEIVNEEKANNSNKRLLEPHFTESTQKKMKQNKEEQKHNVEMTDDPSLNINLYDDNHNMLDDDDGDSIVTIDGHLDPDETPLSVLFNIDGSNKLLNSEADQKEVISSNSINESLMSDINHNSVQFPPSLTSTPEIKQNIFDSPFSETSNNINDNIISSSSILNLIPHLSLENEADFLSHYGSWEEVEQQFKDLVAFSNSTGPHSQRLKDMLIKEFCKLPNNTSTSNTNEPNRNQYPFPNNNSLFESFITNFPMLSDKTNFYAALNVGLSLWQLVQQQLPKQSNNNNNNQ